MGFRIDIVPPQLQAGGVQSNFWAIIPGPRFACVSGYGLCGAANIGRQHCGVIYEAGGLSNVAV